MPEPASAGFSEGGRTYLNLLNLCLRQISYTRRRRYPTLGSLQRIDAALTGRALALLEKRQTSPIRLHNLVTRGD